MDHRTRLIRINDDMKETIVCFLKAHKRGRKHMKTVRADTAWAFGLVDFETNIPPKWKLEIGEEETKKILSLCKRDANKIVKFCEKNVVNQKLDLENYINNLVDYDNEEPILEEENVE